MAVVSTQRSPTTESVAAESLERPPSLPTPYQAVGSRCTKLSSTPSCWLVSAYEDRESSSLTAKERR
eukprot:2666897-Amphidinium_carterae.1